jgi:hypothetical protein
VAAKPSKEELALYALPPEEFVAARNELAKALRKQGSKAQADRVKKLAKPTVPAWAVNAAVAADPDSARELVRSGERRAKAQRGAGGAGAGDALRDAMAAHQHAIEGLMGAVAAALRDGGHEGAANLDRARETLRAVATDERLREELQAGRVSRDREPVGFGSAPEPRGGRARAKDAKAVKGAKGGRAEAAKQERARKAAERAHAAASKAADRARQKLDKAEAAATRARSRVELAEAARDEAARELEAAEEAERDARDALG